ncbi:TetR/AcrR family transcriptional regulator [Polyangium fumosum]|uniref:TetR family transcriptional regulator n=1 Tax=Polyangium fumosum TaxID=889272 RepID=A0A4U1IXZ7_9BACT|nr:TetR/AcrR family transcriptional regulator [Polyangium fumosum]TKC99442.1 TetR family transcriptional regulator [Polyangium fumosum]
MASAGKPHGERRTFIEEARRAQIIECTIAVLASHGYAHASLATIAERAGISKGVISYYFEGKEDLIAQVHAETMTLVTKLVLPAVMKEASASDKLRVYIEGSISFVETHAAHATALLEIWNGLRTPEGRPAFDARAHEPGLEFLEGIMRQGQKEGEFRAFAPRVMALAIRGAIDCVLLQRVAYGDKVDLREAARELVALFDAAMRDVGGRRPTRDAPPPKARRGRR